MKRLAAALLLVDCLPLAGCNDQAQSHDPPTPPANPDKPAVDVHAPGVEVKSDENGTNSATPGR